MILILLLFAAVSSAVGQTKTAQPVPPYHGGNAPLVQQPPYQQGGNYQQPPYQQGGNAPLVQQPSQTETVQYVAAVFRHGEHTGDAATAYPKDPYINETYYPYGVGQLTARGKERLYALGQLFRTRYTTLLGDVYNPDAIDPYTTDMPRTKASVLLVLAGLFPPNGNILEWNSKLNWQPIPYKCLSFDTDPWFTISIYFCSNYAKEYNSYLTNGDGKKLQDKYGKVYEYLRDNTGLNIQRTMEAFFVHSGLQAQNEWGLTLPEWSEQVYPDVLTQTTIDGLSSSIATNRLKQLSGGPLAKRILDTIKGKVNNTFELEGRKLTLYSGHDLNVAYLMGALNVFSPHVVPYGACVFVELHKIGEEHFVKIVYEDYSGDVPKTLTIPGCDALCPLSRFEMLIKPNLPDTENPCGTDEKAFEGVEQHREYYRGRVHYRSLILRFLEWKISMGTKIVKAVIGVGVGVVDKAKDTVIGAIAGGASHLFGKAEDIGGHHHEERHQEEHHREGLLGKIFH